MIFISGNTVGNFYIGVVHDSGINTVPPVEGGYPGMFSPPSIAGVIMSGLVLCRVTVSMRSVHE